MKEIKDIIKFENEEQYNKFMDNLSKYKSAFYKFHEDNNEKFPFEEHSFNDELILVIFLNEYEYSHDIVLKVLDEVLIPKLSIMDKSLVLHFLFGFAVINKDELDKRNEISKIFNNTNE